MEDQKKNYYLSYDIKCIHNKYNWKSPKAIGRIDVILDEDYSRNHVGNSIENLATIRKLVFNLFKIDNSMEKTYNETKNDTLYR